MNTQILIQMGFFTWLSWIVYNKRQLLQMATATNTGSRPDSGPKPPKAVAPVKETTKKKLS